MAEWLNYQHLRYFWQVAHEGSLTRAAELLHLAPSTVSTQVKSLEQMLGSPLFERRGRGLVLTERGHLVRAYADEIFALGEELVETARTGGASGRVTRLRVGVGPLVGDDALWAWLAPALAREDLQVQLELRRDRVEILVGELSSQRLDLLLIDHPPDLATGGQLASVLLGDRPVSLWATPEQHGRLSAGLPGTLTGAPVLLPPAGSEARAAVERWYAELGLRPHVAAELPDRAAIEAFARRGAGLAPLAGPVDGLVELFAMDGVRERVYGLTPQGRRPGPAVGAVLAAAAR